MCQNSKKYKLCTCENLDKADTLNSWTLTRFIGYRKSKIVGKVKRPTEDFGNGITSEKLIFQMNSKNCFDFEYIAKENDCLHISTNENNIHKYFRIIYKDGSWQSGGNPVFVSILENIAKGKLEII